MRFPQNADEDKASPVTDKESARPLNY
jgi:hypothetical protein